MSLAEVIPSVAAAAEARVEGSTLIVELAGRWLLEDGAPRFERMVPENASKSVERIAFDASALDTWDSSLLIFLLQAMDYCEAHELALDTSGLPDQVTRMLT